jgi:hypothetical protein
MTINDMKDEVENFKTAEMRFVLNILIGVRELLDDGESWDNAIESLKRVDVIRYLEKQNSLKNKKTD